MRSTRGTGMPLPPWLLPTPSSSEKKDRNLLWPRMMQRLPEKARHDPSIWIFRLNWITLRALTTSPGSPLIATGAELQDGDLQWLLGCDLQWLQIMRHFPGKTRHDPSSGHLTFRGLWSGLRLRESGELKHTLPGASIVPQRNQVRHRQTTILSEFLPRCERMYPSLNTPNFLPPRLLHTRPSGR